MRGKLVKLTNSSNRKHESNASFLSNGRRIILQKNSTMPLSSVGPTSDLSALLSSEHVSKQLIPNNLTEMKDPKDIRRMIAA